jgi:hypothetical protein
MGIVVLGSVLTFTAVFAASLFSKIRSMDAYRAFVQATGMLASLRSHRASSTLAAGIVAAEAGALLLLPALPAVGLAMTAALMIAFGVAVGRSVRRGSRTTCRCFGASDAPVGRVQVVRNTVLAVVALTGLGAAFGQPATGIALIVILPAGGVALATLAAAALSLLAITAEDLVSLFRPVSTGSNRATKRT